MPDDKHWRNPAKWTTWQERTIEGVTYNFDHLKLFDMLVNRPAVRDFEEMNVTVRVVFDCHVVTKAIEEAEFKEGDPAYWRDTGDKPRLFQANRHEYSKGLPALLSGVGEGKVKCYIAKKNNYMVWEPSNVPPGTAHYQAFFDLYKPAVQPAEGHPLLILYVQSAYLKDEPFAAQRERHQSFGQICAQLLGIVPKKTKGPSNKAKKRP